MTDDLRTALESGLGHRFERPQWLALAVTHRSFHPDTPNNERLEFLGDAVLALAISDLLMQRFPEASEGDLSKRRAALVNAGSLARKARTLDLGAWVRLGKGEEKSGGREKAKILATAYEALLGAVYLDAGYEAARRVVEAHFAAELAAAPGSGHEDWKTTLQELTQRLFHATPTYALVAEHGPDHAKHFESELAVAGRVLARGSGRTKKAAEQAAAMQALDALSREHPEAAR
jgi:ribonuclease-3